MSQAFKLYRLQQIDSRIDRCQARLAEIRAALENADELRQAEAVARQAEQEWQAASKALRSAEMAVKDQRIKIETTEAALYGGKVRNPKELQDLQNESAALKRYLSVLEDRELEGMLVEESQAAQKQQAGISLELAQARHLANLEALHNEQNHLLKELPDLEDERKAAASSIPAVDMNLYEALRKSRRGLAVTLVKDKACQSCGSTLSATLLDATLTSGQVTRCDGCGRILYLG